MVQEINTENIYNILIEYQSISQDGSREQALEALENSVSALHDILSAAQNISDTKTRDNILRILERNLDQIDYM